MDKIENFRKLIMEELVAFSLRKPANMPEVGYEIAFDEQRDQYILFALGWHEEEYIHKWIFHLQIKDQLIWVHEDTTDVGIARKLVERGVPKETIVLGFIPEYERESSNIEISGEA